MPKIIKLYRMEKQNKSLEEIFENIESIRMEVNSKGSFNSLIKEEGGHLYSDGLFERLDDNFSSTSTDYPGMSLFSSGIN